MPSYTEPGSRCRWNDEPARPETSRQEITEDKLLLADWVVKRLHKEPRSRITRDFSAAGRLPTGAGDLEGRGLGMAERWLAGQERRMEADAGLRAASTNMMSQMSKLRYLGATGEWRYPEAIACWNRQGNRRPRADRRCLAGAGRTVTEPCQPVPPATRLVPQRRRQANHLIGGRRRSRRRIGDPRQKLSKPGGMPLEWRNREHSADFEREHRANQRTADD